MQNRYVGDIGDYLKLGILRALSPGHRLGVAWWLHPDQNNGDGRHIDYLNRPEQWRHFEPPLFDVLVGIVTANQRHVSALEDAKLLPGAIFASEVIPSHGPISRRKQARHEWFARTVHRLAEADLVFVDPDNGLEPNGFSHGSAKAGKSVLLSELEGLVKPGRCLIGYHHHTRRKGGHHSEIEYWANRLKECGFGRVDALRAKPYSPRVYFLLDAPPDIRQRAERLESHWQGLITWHPGGAAGGCEELGAPPGHPVAPRALPLPVVPPNQPTGHAISVPLPMKSGRAGNRGTTQPGYVNHNSQEVVRATGIPGNDHGQYVYVLRCRTCGDEYGANGSDIWLRRCPSHDRGAPGLTF